MTSSYDILGVSTHSTKQEIRIAYKRLLKKHHPDTGDGDRTQLENVQKAFAELKNKKESIITLSINVDVSDRDLAGMLGEKCEFKDNISPDIIYTVTVPYNTRIGDTILVKNIINNTNLKINFKDNNGRRERTR
jgi:uncharacterized protein YdaL